MPETSTKLRHDQIVVIVGPTASGKSDLAIALAKKHNGEVISADSRQVYRGMDIGTGKVTRDEVSSHPELVSGSSDQKMLNQVQHDNQFLSEGIRHHLFDVAEPNEEYNVTHFVRDAEKAIEDIQKRGKTPIICGGTGFWVQALLEKNTFPEVVPDKAFREEMDKLSTEDLYVLLKEQDPDRAETIDPKNKVRLIRALEICKALGKVPIQTKSYKLEDKSYFIIALNPDKERLIENIQDRLKKRLQQGMIEEVKHLNEGGVSWERLESFGLEYKNIALFLQGKISEEEMKENIKTESWQYAKRQLTWLRRWEKMGTKIDWSSDSLG